MKKGLKGNTECSHAFACITGKAGISDGLRRNGAFLGVLSLSQRPLPSPTTKTPAQTDWPNTCRLCFLWERSFENMRAVICRWVAWASRLLLDTLWLQCSPLCLMV